MLRIRRNTFVLILGLTLWAGFRHGASTLRDPNIPSASSWQTRSSSSPEVSPKLTSASPGLTGSSSTQLYRIPRDQVTFLHIGKAGGGSVVEEFHRAGVHVDECHPRPCSPQRTREQVRDRTLLLVSIRDPVDRFVSAFYYAVLVLCRQDDDRRRPHRRFWDDPRTRCARRRHHKRDVHLVFHVYQANVSLLAADLCAPAAQPVRRRRARRTVRSLEHLQHGITDWLTINNDNDDDFDWRSEDMFAIVMEPNVTELVHEARRALRWMMPKVSHRTAGVNSSYDDDDDEARRRRLRKPPVPRDVVVDTRHSTSRVKRPLSRTGEACVARYHRTDYEFLRDRREDLCKTDGCRDGIRSILDRRRPFLEGTEPP